MIGINWFAVTLPSSGVEFPYREFDTIADVPRKTRAPGHTTILRSVGGKPRLYYLTDSASEVDLREGLSASIDPSIVNRAIEDGFALVLLDAGFWHLRKQVGGTGYRESGQSPRPQVFSSMHGIRYRCFHGFDGSAFGSGWRWGLVLSYATGQRFTISLLDPALERMAMGERVVPLVRDLSGAAVSSQDESLPSRYVLESVESGVATLVDRDGARQRVDAADWTVPCNRHNLLRYLRATEGPTAAGQVSLRLQQDALALTHENRINTSLAKDQLQRLQALLREHDLLSFHLPLPGHPIVRVDMDVLEVGV